MSDIHSFLKEKEKEKKEKFSGCHLDSSIPNIVGAPGKIVALTFLIMQPFVIPCRMHPACRSVEKRNMVEKARTKKPGLLKKGFVAQVPHRTIVRVCMAANFSPPK